MFELDLLKERARATPGRTALISVATGERLTYADLDARTDRAAAAIRAAGVQEGERYGILGLNSIEFVAFFFAAGRVGAIVVPLSTRATAHELEAIARNCTMKVLFHDENFNLSECGGLPPLFALSPRQAAAASEVVASDRTPEDPYCLLYTSGTTGTPKGVMIPWRQIVFNGYNTVLNWDLRADDVSPVFTPMYHAGGLFAFLVPLFCAGGTIVLHNRFDAAEVWRTIEREHCTVVLGVPTIWKVLMDAPEFRNVDLSHVRWFISGGAPLPAYIIEAYQRRGVVFKQGYGMTEVGVNCFTMTADDSVSRPGSIGKPMIFTEIELRDMDGDVGEMYIRGPHVSLGYWNNEQATRESYLDGGWFRTGDLARRDENGFFYIAGRRKEMFISGGVNVYPAEIEAELLAHPLVNDAAVVPVSDETWGEAGVAFIVGNVTADEIAEYLSVRIARYKVPRRFVFLDSLPRSAYGKVEKMKLKEQLT